MASKRVEDYAYQYKLSNRQAKKRMGGRRRESNIEIIARGVAVAGTGKKCKTATKT